MPAAPLPNQPRRVVILATPAVQPLDVCGPAEVFGMARRKLWETGAAACPGYTVEVRAVGPGRWLGAADGLRVAAAGSHAALRGPVDTLLMADGMQPWAPPPSFLAWLRRWAKRARRIGSVCTGAFTLAAAGLLDGRRATTHWFFAREFAERFPRVRADAEAIFVRDDPRGPRRA